MCVNHPKVMFSQKLCNTLGWLKGFPWVCYSQWEDAAYYLSWVFFDHKNVGSSSLENLYKIAYRTWPTTVETLKKHQNDPTRTQKKSQILFHRFLDE